METLERDKLEKATEEALETVDALHHDEIKVLLAQAMIAGVGVGMQAQKMQEARNEQA